jgi:hypothetical protein
MNRLPSGLIVPDSALPDEKPVQKNSIGINFKLRFEPPKGNTHMPTMNLAMFRFPDGSYCIGQIWNPRDRFGEKIWCRIPEYDLQTAPLKELPPEAGAPPTEAPSLEEVRLMSQSARGVEQPLDPPIEDSDPRPTEG